MPRKAKDEGNTVTEGHEFLSDDTYTGVELSAALSALDAEMGVEGIGQVKCYIYKALPDGREARIWDGTPEDYNLMTVAKRFGSGDYHVKVYSPGPNGRYSLRARKVYPIVLDPGEDQRIEAERKGVIAQATQQPAITPETIAVAVAQALKAAGIGAAPAPAQSLGALKEMADLVKTMMPLMQPAPAAPAVNPMDTMKTMVEMMRAMKEDEDEPPRGSATGMDVLFKLVEKAAPFLEKITAGVTQAGSGAPGVQMLPAPLMSGAEKNVAAGAVQPAAQPDQPAGEDDVNIKLKMGLGFLCMQAEADNDPATYAAMVVDNVPPEVLTGFCERPDFVDFLAQYEPKVKQFAPWFTELRDGVKVEIAERTAPPEGASDAPK